MKESDHKITDNFANGGAPQARAEGAFPKSDIPLMAECIQPPAGAGDFLQRGKEPQSYPPWVFQHGKLFDELDSKRSWDQTKLVNKLNHIHFTDGYIYSLFLQPETGEQILIKTHPQPCIKEELTCDLAILDSQFDLSPYKFNYLMIEDGLTTILAPANLVERDGFRLKLSLPEKSYIITNRRTRRFPSQNISSEVVQNNHTSRGTLVDFTPQAFGINVSVKDDLKKFDESNPAMVTLAQNGTKLFSGLCRCIRKEMNLPDGKIIFTPLDTRISLFPKREFRNPRQQITPSFSISFKHPLFQGIIERDIFDISTSGFSVQDKTEDETLLPGMIIPKITIIYAGILKMECSAQVIYRHENEGKKTVHCGLAITDMDVKSYSYLNHILGTYIDNYARVSTEVDMDALWEFFFDSNFIYGEKYEHLQSHREIFKETYRKLYQDNSEIARHFVYEKNGNIYGHMSMVHAYEQSWLIHHFAAKTLESRIPGLMILRQIEHYINGYYRLTSGGMGYLMAYYRPETRLMHKIYAGFVGYLGNPKGSSLDLFSYIKFQKGAYKEKLPQKWVLRKCIPSDFKKLKLFYDAVSGGLLLEALGLENSLDKLKELFSNAGFKRNCQTFCLCLKNEQVAFFIVNQSDLGMNLSDIINGIKIIVTNSDALTVEVLFSAIGQLSIYYEEDEISLLIYPEKYISDHGIETKKHYQLWILKTDPYAEQYNEYMDKKFRIRYRT